MSLRTETRVLDGQPVPLLVSAVIPPNFRHGFSFRAGGVSAPPYDSFNLGFAWGDRREDVLENRRRLLAWMEVERLYLVRQVHGATIARVGAVATAAELAAQEADGLVTDVPGAAVGVFTADCVPLLLADPITGSCAAVHAGWRGVVAGVAGAAVQALGVDHGARPADLRVAMGPAIGPCCFEVGPEVAEAFERRRPPDGGPGVVVPRQGARPQVDLRRALTLELQDLGVPAAQIDAGGECTRCDPERRFFSYRRDANRTGQQLSVIARR